ncbi:unnamed protein product [Adineta ricciae]|uniref:Uncharacterized protein n=1 Tax=Adineta ricciae TaxID=249248 RepID=A0A814H7T1_ADIRI|nr:unnamed protein product [Adineta ricciae]
MANHCLHVLICCISLLTAYQCHGYSATDEISLDAKVQQSPLIVLGISLNKHFYTNIHNVFNVSFLVQCILKGEPTQQVIQIVQAGSLLGRRAHQNLDANREYLVFLEPFFQGTYRPVDLEDIPYSIHIDDLLATTCGLSRTYPFMEANDTEAALINKCPAVVSVHCQSIETKKTSEISSITTPSIPLFNEQDPLELEALSLLFTDHSSQNLSAPNFPQKSLYSDDQTHKNRANQFSFPFLFHFILFNILHFSQ